MSFKAPKYQTLLDPRHIDEGYLRKLFTVDQVTEHDFFIAVSEAHRRYQRLRERWFKLMMEKEPFRPSTPAMKALETAIEYAADGVLWLIGGLLGRYLNKQSNLASAEALKRMESLLKQARKRSQREARAARLKQASQISGGGFRVPFSRENAPKGKR